MDKWDLAFSRSHQSKDLTSSHTYIPPHRSTKHPIHTTNHTSIREIKRGYTIHKTQCHVNDPYDDPRFAGKFGSMDKFLYRIPELVIKTVLLYYLELSDLVHLDSAVCGGMRRRYRAALRGHVLSHCQYAVNVNVFKWLLSRGIVAPDIRISSQERSVTFLCDCTYLIDPFKTLQHVTSFSISRCDMITDDGVALPSSCMPHLIALDVSFCTELSIRGIKHLISAGGPLQFLNVSQTSCITDSAFQIIAPCISSLTELVLSGCCDITDSSLVTVSKECPNLTSLDLSHCYGITVNGLQALADGCRCLESLSLQHCMDGITDEGIQCLSHSCIHLTSLDISGCSRLTDVAFLAISQCLDIRSVGWYISARVTDDMLIALSRRSHLDVLGFERPTGFTSVGFAALASGCSNLRELKLVNSVSDADLICIAQGCNGLTQVHLGESSDSCTVTDLGILALSNWCSRLKVLRLPRSVHVTDISLTALSRGCPELNTLSINGTNVTDAGIFSIRKGCMLQTLNISDAVRVTDSGIKSLCANNEYLMHLTVDNCFLSPMCVRELSRLHIEIFITLNNSVSVS